MERSFIDLSGVLVENGRYLTYWIICSFFPLLVYMRRIETVKGNVMFCCHIVYYKGSLAFRSLS